MEVFNAKWRRQTARSWLTKLATAVLSAGLAACGTPGPLPDARSSSDPDGHAKAPSGPLASVPRREPEFAWPAKGPVVNRFDGDSNRGIDVASTLGDAVLAARDGRVVLVSNALAAYGNMVVVMHDPTLLTAYAHLGTPDVKEGDMVRRGQRIADVGRNAAGDAVLHFEIRERGTPVDPLPYLHGLRY